ncbi:hypothetical protein NQD34_006434 [Periophthalmus magnuspinnatus]|nr:hypothetical protein NQD34_006434 [Periophthalmus magnuspinnatus]
MEPEFFLLVVLLSVLLFTGSIGQVVNNPVFRFHQKDHINLDHEDEDLRGEHDRAVPELGLAFDEGSPVQPNNDPPYEAEKPPQGSSVNNEQPASHPQSAQRFFHAAVPDENSQSGNRPLTFPRKLRQESQWGYAMPVPQPSPHPYRIYGANPRTNSYRHVNNQPQVYPGHPSGQYRPVSEQQGSPAGHSTHPKPANVPVGHNQWFHTNYGPVDHRNQMNVPPKEAELSMKPNHWPRRPSPRYVVHSNNGYLTNRYSISRLAYDPEYGLWKR